MQFVEQTSAALGGTTISERPGEARSEYKLTTNKLKKQLSVLLRPCVSMILAGWQNALRLQRLNCDRAGICQLEKGRFSPARWSSLGKALPSDLSGLGRASPWGVQHELTTCHKHAVLHGDRDLLWVESLDQQQFHTPALFRAKGGLYS
ncbi:hypothetical protein ElyMa_004097100 [Elysia marginata]|uniref:Uncharacterized protein n=1 Tax=Elysia marginata TaxID=1093978 RepID=A0AAV4GDE5_9GAST|nr:hypothetical protein ElyMa_004097100 [Elysia marginata]